MTWVIMIAGTLLYWAFVYQFIKVYNLEGQFVRAEKFATREHVLREQGFDSEEIPDALG